MMYALDTNTAIYFFKGMGRVAQRLFRQASDEVFLPAVVLHELEVGLARSNSPRRRRGQLQKLVEVLRVLPFDAAVAQTTATLRAQLEQQGTPIGPLDTLIAGTALHHGAVLVTHNQREFGRVEGLRVEDWF